MNTSSLLKSIGSGSDPQEIIQNLATIKSQVAKSKHKILSAEEVEEVTEQVDNSIQSVILLQDDIGKLNDLLNLYQAKADENIPYIKSIIDISIIDYTSAFDATQTYSKEWFANSLYSEEGKIDLAEYIKNTVQTYCNDNLETLSMIADRDNDIMTYIRFPRPDDES